MVKKVTVMILFLGIIVLMSTGCGTKEDFEIQYQDQDECHKPQLLLTKDGKNIYTYCLEDSEVHVNKQIIELKKYIEDKDDAIGQIIKSLDLKDTLSDGGTQVYKGNITLVQCNTLDGNNDVYIGNDDMKFKQNFCKNNNYTFIRTYTVKDVSIYTEQQYEDGIPVSYGNSFKVILSEFQGETKTVIINNSWDVKLEKGKTYEFEFMLYNDLMDIKDDIEYIFKNSTIIEVRETDKTGLAQIQESMKISK